MPSKEEFRTWISHSPSFFYTFSFPSNYENGSLHPLYFPKVPKGNDRKIEQRPEVSPGLGSM